MSRPRVLSIYSQYPPLSCWCCLTVRRTLSCNGNLHLEYQDSTGPPFSIGSLLMRHRLRLGWGAALCTHFIGSHPHAHNMPLILTGLQRLNSWIHAPAESALRANSAASSWICIFRIPLYLHASAACLTFPGRFLESAILISVCCWLSFD